jgi:hypothetical protein
MRFVLDSKNLWAFHVSKFVLQTSLSRRPPYRILGELC